MASFFLFRRTFFLLFNVHVWLYKNIEDYYCSFTLFVDHSNTVMCVRFARSSYRFCSTAMDFTSVVYDMQNYRNQTHPHSVLKLG